MRERVETFVEHRHLTKQIIIVSSTTTKVLAYPSHLYSE